jgi:hypothetical protein
MVIAFLSCNMIKSLIKSVNSLGLKEAEYSVASAGNLTRAVCEIEFDAKVTDRPKTTQPDTDLYNAHKV